MGTLVVKEKTLCPSASLMPCPTWRLLTVFVHVELPFYPCSLSPLHFFKENPVNLWALSQENFYSLAEVLVMVYWALSDTAHPCIHSTFHMGSCFILSIIRETVVTIPIS